MKIVKKKSLQTIREEKEAIPELERTVTDLEIEGYRKDATIAGLEETIAEDEQAITELEIEIAKLKGVM